MIRENNFLSYFSEMKDPRVESGHINIITFSTNYYEL